MAAAKKKAATAAVEEKAAETKAVETKAVETKAAKTPAAEKKAAPKRVCKKVSIELQYGEKCVDVASLEGLAVAAWAEATGKAKTAAKSINLYVKPEENALYYVIEGESGKVEL
ncbi:MAG: hypothetical protein IJ496_10050 [Ruminococcus sp.]|nr:hypothetical protein [Ruminococcus sp.]